MRKTHEQPANLTEDEWDFLKGALTKHQLNVDAIDKLQRRKNVATRFDELFPNPVLSSHVDTVNQALRYKDVPFRLCVIGDRTNWKRCQNERPLAIVPWST